jgi:hypothetical protein
LTARTTISLQDDVFIKAKGKADKYFGKNLSAYITNLICRDGEEMTVTEKEKDSNILSAVDEILNI